MPYYCTVPRCTSMAGKAKNVSFHQFPRDENLAELWNQILKRGKPYTKYSKVCSLHFTSNDYTITSVGKNKGHWKTLKKDAIPSRNLPSDSSGPSQRKPHSTTRSNSPPSIMDSQLQHQMAHAVYMQSMLAMQTTSAPHSNGVSRTEAKTLNENQSETENQVNVNLKEENVTSYKCQDCSKCFKDPDVLLIHRRTHTSPDRTDKENLDANITNDNSIDTLRANPILANLLKNGTQSHDGNTSSIDVNNILSIENQILTALAVNMQAYISTLSSIITDNESTISNDVDLQQN